MNYTCDKCKQKLDQRVIVGVYKISEKRKVKVCFDCSYFSDYILTFYSKRKMGYTVPKGN